MSGDADRSRVNVAGQYFAVQQFRCGDRENPGSGSDVERSVKLPSTRQALERQETAAGRRMLAGTERGRRVYRDPDRSRRHLAIMMRAVNKEPADPQGRKGQLVLREPVASRQLFLAELGQSSASGSRGKRELRPELRVEQRRLPIGLDPPLLGRGLKRRYGVGSVVEEHEHGIRRVRAANLREQAPERIQGKCPSPRPSPRKRGEGASRFPRPACGERARVRGERRRTITRARRRRP